MGKRASMPLAISAKMGWHIFLRFVWTSRSWDGTANRRNRAKSPCILVLVLGVLCWSILFKHSGYGYCTLKQRILLFTNKYTRAKEKPPVSGFSYSTVARELTERPCSGHRCRPTLRMLRFSRFARGSSQRPGPEEWLVRHRASRLRPPQLRLPREY